VADSIFRREIGFIALAPSQRWLEFSARKLQKHGQI
jgi:hypothetical protein